MRSLGELTTVFQLQSTLIVILLLVGFALRGQPRKHVKIMSFAIFWDICLVLQIELNRNALNKAAQFFHNFPILNIHVALAILTVLLYGAMIYTGRRLLKGDIPVRPVHKKLGIATLGVRLLVYATSFFVVK